MTASGRRRPALLSTSLTAGRAALPHVVRGEGVWFVLDDGRRVIDASNTACPLGHAHPAITEAVRRAADSPVVNEGWRWQEREQAAQDLLEIAFAGEEWAAGVRFFISGSEANDAALSLCQALTGRAGLVTRARAYHGGSGLAREMTVQPHWHGGLSTGGDGILPVPRLAPVHQLPAPASARVTGQPDPTSGDDWIPAARDALAESAAVILDYSQGGIYHSPNYQDRVAAVAQEEGTYWIADEVVTGFGRTGGWMAFQAGTTRPDMVTLGKPLAAGGAAAGALVLSRTVLDRLAGMSWQSYSTFRGHPVMIAAIRAHLEVSAREGLPQRARDLEAFMFEQLGRLAAAHPGVARIDGRGLHWTVELHGPDWRHWHGQEAEPLASRVAARALEHGVLFATSGEQTSLFLAPPLIVSQQELGQMFDALDDALVLADHEHEQSAAE